MPHMVPESFAIPQPPPVYGAGQELPLPPPSASTSTSTVRVPYTKSTHKQGPHHPHWLILLSSSPGKINHTSNSFIYLIVIVLLVRDGVTIVRFLVSYFKILLKVIRLNVVCRLHSL